MKKSTKVLLTTLLIVTVVVSILGSISAFIMFANNFGDFYNEFSLLADGVRSSERADVTIATLFSFTNVVIFAALALIFIFIPVGCIAGVVYIYVADSDERIKELETIVEEAHMNIKYDSSEFGDNEDSESETLYI